ncbi:MAG: hypothetical protein JG777_2505, partial [Clostridia bacterium]|nr:hypothetical protein [Clostridia bacterium]
MVKRNLIYFIIFAAFFLSALYSGEQVLYMISYAMLFLPLVSLLLLIITVLRYKYVEQIEKRQAVRGEVLNYSLDVYNEDVFLYPYIKTNFYAGNFLTNNLFNDETFYIPP